MNDTPSWFHTNRFACLSIDNTTDDDDSDSLYSVSESTCEVIEAVLCPPPKPPKPFPYRRLKRWEKRLPRRLVVAATGDARSLNIRIELISSVNSSRVSTMAMVDSGATNMGYVDVDFV